MHDPERYREESVRSWDSVASAWERHRETTRRASAPLETWLLDRLAPSPGQTILDLAAGPGDSGLEIAQRLAGNGRVLMVDQSRAMLETVRRRAEALGLSHVETAVMDGARLELDDAAVDGVICRFGYMLMPDPAAALAETRRVLRRGGRLVFAVWGESERNPWATVIGPVLIDHGLMQRPDQGGPGMFALADRARLDELVARAGFEQRELASIPVQWPYESFDAYWETATEMSPMMSRAVAETADGELAGVRDAAALRYREALDEEGRLPGLAYAMAAR